MKKIGYVEDKEYFIQNCKVYLKKERLWTDVTLDVESELKRSVWRERYHEKSRSFKELSLDAEYDDGKSLSDCIKDSSSPDPELSLIQKQVFDFKTLDLKEREILWLAYNTGLTDKEIGKLINLSQQMVNYKRNVALKKAKCEIEKERE